MRYHYPGNIRQLRNILEHSVVLCRSDRIDVECLPLDLLEEGLGGGLPERITVGRPLVEAEAAAIAQALREHSGHRGKTAAALGIDRLHPEQEKAIAQAMSGGDALVVLPTGYGKSACYQIPSMLLPQPVIVISPLLALLEEAAVAERSALELVDQAYRHVNVTLATK